MNILLYWTFEKIKVFCWNLRTKFKTFTQPSVKKLHYTNFIVHINDKLDLNVSYESGYGTIHNHKRRPIATESFFAEIGYWQVLSFGEKFWNRKRNELLTHECILIYLNIFCIIIAKKGKKSINDQIFSYITFLPNDHNSYNNLFFSF